MQGWCLWNNEKYRKKIGKHQTLLIKSKNAACESSFNVRKSQAIYQ